MALMPCFLRPVTRNSDIGPASRPIASIRSANGINAAAISSAWLAARSPAQHCQRHRERRSPCFGQIHQGQRNRSWSSPLGFPITAIMAATQPDDRISTPLSRNCLIGADAGQTARRPACPIGRRSAILDQHNPAIRSRSRNCPS